MGRLVLILGIIFIVIGGASIVVGLVGGSSSFLSTITDAINPTAEELCNPGESLKTETGPETYSPTTGYGRNVRFFCVNDAGDRREVTGNFVQGMLGQVFGSMPTMIFPALGGCVLTLGFFLLVIGAILSARRRGSPRMVTQSYGFDFPPDTPQTSIPRSAPRGGDLSARLRQLDEARQANLITEDEYQRMRKDILDSIG